MLASLPEINDTVVSAAIGLAPRFQIGASVPRVVGSADGTGPVGGIGTSYVSGKIGLLTGADGVKLAVSPVLQILGNGAVQALAPQQSRTQVGLPVSLEVSQGPTHVFASAGVFSGGAWFAGGGTAIQATARLGLSFNNPGALVRHVWVSVCERYAPLRPRWRGLRVPSQRV